MVALRKHSITEFIVIFLLLQTTDIAKLVSEAWREMPPEGKPANCMERPLFLISSH
jgi:hypothetical protein